MGRETFDLFVIDKEYNEVHKLSECGIGSVISRVAYKMMNPNARVEDEHEIAEYIKAGRFEFVSKAKLESLAATSLSTRNPLVDNIDFQKKYGFDIPEFDLDKLKFRMDLLKEEYNETVNAVADKNAEEVVDGLVDLVVIALGTLHLAGVDANKAWSEVFRANMSKERGVKPGREQSGGWDVIKPEGWVGPNHGDNHGKLEEIFSEN